MMLLLYTGTSALIIFPKSREHRNIVQSCTSTHLARKIFTVMLKEVLHPSWGDAEWTIHFVWSATYLWNMKFRCGKRILFYCNSPLRSKSSLRCNFSFCWTNAFLEKPRLSAPPPPPPSQVPSLSVSLCNIFFHQMGITLLWGLLFFVDLSFLEITFLEYPLNSQAQWSCLQPQKMLCFA